VLERTLGAPGSVAEQMRESQANSERCPGCYEYSFGGLQVLSWTLRMYTCNQFYSSVNIMHGLLFIVTSESY